jgi:hypothetical protein
VPTPDPDLLVLHVLRLKGFADTGAVVSSTGLDVADVATRLEKAQADGFATHREGRITGWSLTSAGRAAHKELVEDEIARADGAREAIATTYQSFLDINGALLAVCTDWQLRNGALNDHADAAYDDAVVARLGEVDAAVQPLCADASHALARFSRYGPRLASALDKVRHGDTEWFAKPVLDSYHSVWFELHEDLLVTLGLERSKEGGS